MKQWYEKLFENYAIKYDDESFTQGTIGECDFIEKEIAYNKAAKILDIGCGTGRHTIELTKRGYNVVGVDLSESMLQRARQKAAEENLNIVFENHDARKLPYLNQFDLVIMLCEGGFSLMETDQMNFEILQNAANALKPKSKFIFTTLNALFPMFHSVKQFLDQQVKAGDATYKDYSFDLMTLRDSNIINIVDDSGNKKEIQCNERYYLPSEITWQLQTLNFQIIDIFGAKLGAFSRSNKLSTEDYEMLVIAQRK